MIIFFFLALSFASPQIEKYCFASTEEVLKAQRQIDFILIKNQDKTLLEGNCLTIAVESERVELVKRWVTSHFPSAQLSFSSSTPSSEECRIKLKKLSKTQLENFQGGLNQQRVNLQAGNQIEEAQDIRMIRTLSGKETTLELDRFRLKLVCTYHSSSSYTLELKGETVPLPPRTTTTQTPYGVTTVVEQPAQKMEVIETSINIRKNEEVNIGQTFNDLSKKNKDLNLANPNFHTSSGESLNLWFISIY